MTEPLDLLAAAIRELKEKADKYDETQKPDGEFVLVPRASYNALTDLLKPVPEQKPFAVGEWVFVKSMPLLRGQVTETLLKTPGTVRVRGDGWCCDFAVSALGRVVATAAPTPAPTPAPSPWIFAVGSRVRWAARGDSGFGTVLEIGNGLNAGAVRVQCDAGAGTHWFLPDCLTLAVTHLARRVFPDELERLRSENRELREKLRNAVANFSREQDENGRLRTKLAHPSPTPYLKRIEALRIEALRQALADIMTGNANPGALVPDAYMIRANAALQADDKARGPLPPTQHKPLDRVPSWSIDTPPSWGK